MGTELEESPSPSRWPASPLRPWTRLLEPPSAPGPGLWENTVSGDSGMEAREREAKCDFWGLAASKGQRGLGGAV